MLYALWKYAACNVQRAAHSVLCAVCCVMCVVCRGRLYFSSCVVARAVRAVRAAACSVPFVVCAVCSMQRTTCCGLCAGCSACCGCTWWVLRPCVLFFVRTVRDVCAMQCVLWLCAGLFSCTVVCMLSCVLWCCWWVLDFFLRTNSWWILMFFDLHFYYFSIKRQKDFYLTIWNIPNSTRIAICTLFRLSVIWFVPVGCTGSAFFLSFFLSFYVLPFPIFFCRIGFVIFNGFKNLAR